MSFSEWVNKTSMQSLRSLVIMVVFVIVIGVFTVMACILLMDETASNTFQLSINAIRSDTTRATLEAVAAMRAAAQTSETSHHMYGMQVVNALITLMGIAIGANVVGQGVDRFSAKEHVEAKERGRVAGAAAAAVAAQAVADAKLTTKEHPTPPRPAGMGGE